MEVQVQHRIRPFRGPHHSQHGNLCPPPQVDQVVRLYGGTVDGSEIRRPPVEVGSLSHYLQGFSTIPGGCLGLLNHQQ